MGERRESKRYLEKTRAVINYYAREGSLYQSDYFASTHDLSMNGARLVTHHPFAIDTDLIVSLDLSTVNKLAQLWGKVKWVEKRQKMGLYDIGVEFVDSSDPVEDFTKRFKRG